MARKDKNSCFLDLHTGIRDMKRRVLIMYLSFLIVPFDIFCLGMPFMFCALKSNHKSTLDLRTTFKLQGHC